MKYKVKTYTFLILILILALSITASAEKLNLRLAHTQAATNQAHIVMAMGFAEEVEKLSKGQITVDVFPAAQLGSEREIMEGLGIGTIDVVMEGPSRIAHFNKLADIFSVPYLTRDRDHFEKVWHGPVGEEIAAVLEESTGIKIICFAWRGARNLQTTKPVKSLRDLRGLKIRVPPIQLWLDIWERLGTSPTPMDAAEVYMAINQGVVQGQENPLAVSYHFKFHEVAKYWAITEHVLDVFSLMMDSQKYNSIPEEYQKIILEAANKSAEEFGKATDFDNEEALQKMIEEGCEVYYIDKQEIREALKGFEDSLKYNYPDIVTWYEKIVEVK